MPSAAAELRLAEALSAYMPPPAHTRAPERDVSGAALDRLGAICGGHRVALLRDDIGEWEARTIDGDAGRGATLAEALDELLAELDG